MADPVTRAYRRMLEDLPISVVQLAERSGVKRPTLQAVKDGHFNLTPENTKKIIAALRELAEDIGKHADALEAAAKKRGD